MLAPPFLTTFHRTPLRRFKREGKMSWQAYVDTNLLASGMVTAAGIYDLQGNPWAYSAGFAAQVAEVAAISGHLAADPNGLAGTGFVVAGVKYMYVRGETNEYVIGKKGAEGVMVFKCNTCVIVAYHDDKITSGACNHAVSKLADFLKESNI